MIKKDTMIQIELIFENRIKKAHAMDKPIYARDLMAIVRSEFKPHLNAKEQIALTELVKRIKERLRKRNHRARASIEDLAKYWGLPTRLVERWIAKDWLDIDDGVSTEKIGGMVSEWINVINQIVRAKKELRFLDEEKVIPTNHNEGLGNMFYK